MQIVLIDGTHHSVNLDEPEKYEHGTFAQTTLVIDPESVFPRSGPMKGYTEMTIAELKGDMAELRKPEHLSAQPDHGVAEEVPSIPVACLAFMLIALGMGVSYRRDAVITLYSAASYDEALVALEGAGQLPLSPGEQVELERHRMLCLLALGRTAAAVDAAARLLEQQPGYVLSEGDAAPHVRAMLETTRRQVVPEMIRRTYEDGKRAFDAGEYGRAGEVFTQLGLWLADAHVAAADPSFADLRTLSNGFLELSRSGAARHATASAAAEAPTPLLAATRPELPWSAAVAVRMDPASIDPPAEETNEFVASAAPTATVPPRFAPLDFFTFDARDKDVVPPQAVSQEITGWWGSRGEPPAGTPLGTIDLVIDDAGRVVEARIHQSVNRVYDAVLLQSAKQWRYLPASRSGRPVRYRRITSIVSVR